jgi:ABC-type sugar transport system ATPase subunit
MALVTTGALLPPAERSAAAPAMPLVELEAASLSYGPVDALLGVSLALKAGEILALCGDNGAGKSSLVKIVAGVHAPTTGRLLVGGRPVRLRGPRDALQCGIATIYQDLALVPRLPVWQNVFLGSELRLASPLGSIGFLDKPRMRQESRGLLSGLGITVPDVDGWVESLSGGQRQAVAIARALRWQARLLIMDEPTAALGVRETAEVLGLMRALRAQGVAVLLVSHDMQDVIDVADRVAILKRGRLAGLHAARDLDPDRLAHLIMAAA